WVLRSKGRLLGITVLLCLLRALLHPRVVAVYSRKYDRRYRVGRWSNVRFGSEADICSAISYVRFGPESHPHKQILSAQVVPSNIPSDFLHRRVFESLAQLTS